MKVLKPTMLAFLCAVLLVTTNHRTRAVIVENQQHFAEKTLRDMVGSAELIKQDTGFSIWRDGTHIGFIQRNSTNKGYNGRIELFIAYTVEGEIIGVRVLDHQETPGIGDKIDHEVSPWIDGFKGRSPANTNWQLSPAGDIDGITGATITSRATLNMIREVLPR
jgi:electron transport complex protein RnfG